MCVYIYIYVVMYIIYMYILYMHILYTFNFIIPPFVQPAPQIIVVDYVYWLKAAKDSTQERTRGTKIQKCQVWGISEGRTIGWKPKRVLYNVHMLSYFKCACMYIYICMHTQAIEEVAQCLRTAVSGRFFMFHLFRGNEPIRLLESQPLVQSACLLASKAFHLLPFTRPVKDC